MCRRAKAAGRWWWCFAENKELDEGADKQHHGQLTKNEPLSKGKAARISKSLSCYRARTRTEPVQAWVHLYRQVSERPTVMERLTLLRSHCQLLQSITICP